MAETTAKFKIREYLNQKQIELYNTLANKIVIYLDTKFWIALKYQSLQPEKERPFFNLVSDLTSNGRCIFPISEIIFWEVLKHTDKNSLKDTIEIIDRFSGGIAFATSREMICLEIRSFYKSLMGKDSSGLRPLAWTKLSFAAFPEIVEKLLSEITDNEALSRFIIDRYWNFSFENIFKTVSEYPGYTPFKFVDNVSDLNEKKKIHESDYKTFDELFLIELFGTMNLFDDVFGLAIAEDYYEVTGRRATKEELKSADSSKIRNAAFYAFKNGKISHQLPSFRIFSGVFAGIRWNKTQKHHKNDTLDASHASFALPNCDFFFTEKSLSTLLTQNHTGYDKLFSCKVLSSEAEAVEILTILNTQ